MSDAYGNDDPSAEADNEAIDLGVIAARMEQQREKSRSFLADQKCRLDGIEARLSHDIAAITDKLQAWVDYESAVTDWHDSVEHQETELAHRRAEFEQSCQQETESLRSERAAIEAGETEQLSKLHAEIQDLQVRFEDEANAAAEVRGELEELAERTAAEREEMRAALESELQATRESLNESGKEKSELEEQLSQTAQELQEHIRRISTLEERIQELSSDGSGADSDELLVAARAERDNLLEEIARLKNQQEQQQTTDQAELAKLHHNFELAVQKVRELKARNTKLEERLRAFESASTAGEHVSDWEEHKKRVIAELEGRNVAPDESRVDSPSSAAVEADDIADEREKLKKLQTEWEEKLRAAEVEISIERAQNARMRSELQEKLRDLEEQLDRVHKESAESPQDNNGKSRRRWLDRLGLSDD